MYSLKQVASWYKCDTRVIVKYLMELGITRGNKEKGKGKRCLLTPIEVALLKQRVGEPLKQ